MERILSEADVHGYIGIVMVGLGLGYAINIGIGAAVVGFLLIGMGFMLGRAEPEPVKSDPHAFDALVTTTGDDE